MQESTTDTNNEDQFTEELISAPVEKKAKRIDTRELKDEAARREKKGSLSA